MIFDDEWSALISGLCMLVGFLLYKRFGDLFLGSSKGGGSSVFRPSNVPNTIRDQYESLDDLKADLRKGGVDCVGLIVGIDFTASNRESGCRTYNGHSLHHLYEDGTKNAYESVVQTIMNTLLTDRRASTGDSVSVGIDDDGLVPMFGFGDSKSRDQTVFPVCPEPGASTTAAALAAYRATMQDPSLRLSGPTSITPLIRKAIEIVKRTKQHHLLLIIADGQLTHFDRDMRTVAEASQYPLSITMVGVGDGPWDSMEALDDDMDVAGRRFDNFQFVDYEKCRQFSNPDIRKAMFARNVLMELPEQSAAIQQLGLLERL